MSGFLKKEYFNLLKEYDGIKCNKDDLSHTQVYEILKEANNLTKIWAEKVIDALFDQGHLGGFRNKPTNQGQKFKPYTWAKIYPRKTAPKQLAFTVGIDAYSGFVVKIDTVNIDNNLRLEYEKIRGDFESSMLVSMLPIEAGLAWNLEELVKWSVEEIDKFKFRYNEICNALDLADEHDFTVQQALDFLTIRYPQSKQATEKLFVCINQDNKEIALETRDLQTTTIRIFIEFAPPEAIIPSDRCRFIPSNSDGKNPNSNLNNHTFTLRAEDDFYQVSPNTQLELNHLCNWLDGKNDIIQAPKLEKQQGEYKYMDKSLNRILFGAAGTGKTYNTINHALSILDPEYDPKLDRKELKKRFDAYKEQGQIKFVTFHQSFSYEDFVEGIRAETNDEGQLSYEVKAGVFKEICEKAKGTAQQKNHIDEVIDAFLAEIIETPLTLNTQQNKQFTVTYLGSGLTLQCQPLASEANATYYANIGKIKSLLLGEDVEKVYNRSYIKAVAEYLKPKLQNQKQTKPNQKYVLIIDEINRGNISRIFGELITLIEESKRQGAEEELSVTLPYSKEEFSVPKNVYIIGTMNSSDRSLTGLDIALRRRFTFIEMPPQPKEIKNEHGELLKISGKDKNGIHKDVIVADILSVINQRIEVLLDRDHCIGHANFMSLKEQPTLEHLATIFKQKIIPQLQEYFFDDWAKINMVLFNNEMIIEEKINIAELFPPNTSEDLHYSEQKKIWKINEDAFKTIDAFINILGSKG